MKDYKVLALDETGKASFNHPSKNFVLSGNGEESQSTGFLTITPSTFTVFHARAAPNTTYLFQKETIASLVGS